MLLFNADYHQIALHGPNKKNRGMDWKLIWMNFSLKTILDLVRLRDSSNPFHFRAQAYASYPQPSAPSTPIRWWWLWLIGVCRSVETYGMAVIFGYGDTRLPYRSTQCITLSDAHGPVQVFHSAGICWCMLRPSGYWVWASLSTDLVVRLRHTCMTSTGMIDMCWGGSWGQINLTISKFRARFQVSDGTWICIWKRFPMSQ